MSLTPYEQPETSVMQGDPTGGRLVAWARGLTAAKQMGDALCTTAFVPSHFRDKPEDAAAAIMSGDEIGFTPMQSLQNLYVISGKPALYARAMVALVLSRGHQMWTEKDTDTEVVICGQRNGSDRIEKVSWTIDRARKAGYTNNKKYTSDPQSMLYARASSDVARRIAPDVLAGVAYSVEEMELEQPTAKRKISRAKAERPPTPEPEIQPETPDPEPQTEQVADTGETVTDAQLKRMHASFGDLSIIERQARLNYVIAVIKRDVESSKDLTKREASDVIEALEDDSRNMQTPEPELDS